MVRHSLIVGSLLVAISFVSGPPCRGQSTNPSVSKVAETETYRLGPGDRLRITVFNVDDLTGEYSISPAGNVAIPLAGDVPASGNTTEALSASIREKLTGAYVRDPKVTVEVIAYRPFYILGEVNQPGEFAYRPNITVEQAVAAAGGYTYRAARKKAYLRRTGGGESLVKFGKDAPVVYVMPGDTIRIGERYF